MKPTNHPPEHIIIIDLKRRKKKKLLTGCWCCCGAWYCPWFGAIPHGPNPCGGALYKNHKIIPNVSKNSMGNGQKKIINNCKDELCHVIQSVNSPASAMMSLCIWWALWNILINCWLLCDRRMNLSRCTNLLYHSCIFSGHRSIAHVFVIANGTILWWRTILWLYHSSAQYLHNIQLIKKKRRKNLFVVVCFGRKLFVTHL